MNRRPFSAIIISLFVSLCAIAIVWRAIEWDQLREAVGRLEPAYIPILVAIYMSSHLLRGLRWKWMLSPIRVVMATVSTSVVIIGYMANNLLPLRLGEFVRALLMARRCSLHPLTTLSSVGAERVLDGLTLLLFLAISLVFVPMAGDSQSRLVAVAVIVAAVFLSISVAVIGMRWKPLWARTVYSRLASCFPVGLRAKLLSLYDAVEQSIYFVNADLFFVRILFISLCVWGVEALMYLVGLRAFGLPARMDVALFTLSVVNLGVLIPSAPGYVGIFQLGTVVAFGAFGWSADVAAAYSIVIHLCQYLPVTAIGLVLLVNMGTPIWKFQELVSWRSDKKGMLSSVPLAE